MEIHKEKRRLKDACQSKNESNKQFVRKMNLDVDEMRELVERKC